MKTLTKLAAVASIALLASCSSSVVNVYDQYIKTGLEKHAEGENSTSKRKLLLRETDKISGQIELIAFKKDSVKYLVVGSLKNARSFKIEDNTYTYDLNELYGKDRTEEFMERAGGLTLYFTEVEAGMASMFATALNGLKAQYASAVPGKDETISIDYTLSSNLIISLEKSSRSQKPEYCTVWVGKRKHIIKTWDLEKALTDLKMF